MNIDEILDKLVGDTDVWCETYHDMQSLANLEILEDIAKWLENRISENLKYKDRPEYSAQQIANRTKELIINSGLDMIKGEE